MASGVRVKINPAGVVEALHSAGVASWVRSTVEGLAASANASARDHLTAQEMHVIQHYEPGAMTDAPYEGVVKQGRWDTLGVVRSASLWGAVDSNQHHTLDSLNH